MTRAERFMSVWIENNGYQYDNFPVGECMQSYADHQLKNNLKEFAEWFYNEELGIIRDTDIDQWLKNNK